MSTVVFTIITTMTDGTILGRRAAPGATCRESVIQEKYVTSVKVTDEGKGWKHGNDRD